MVNTDSPGKTYTLGGPAVRSKAEVVDFITKGICRPESSVMELPEPAVRLYAKAMQFLPTSWRLLSPDDVDQLEDNLCVPRNGLGCEDLGLVPASMEKEGGTMFPFHRGSRDGTRSQFDEDSLPKRYGTIEQF
jgi:hypothetical protein